MPEWKDTVNLPRTEFPMKANLATSEAATLAHWKAINLYGRSARAAGPPKFVLHDGRLRERQHPHGHGAEQDPEGARRQIALDGRVRRAVCGGA
jgi:isoleucyl-tRNA synthetase